MLIWVKIVIHQNFRKYSLVATFPMLYFVLVCGRGSNRRRIISNNTPFTNPQFNVFSASILLNTNLRFNIYVLPIHH